MNITGPGQMSGYESGNMSGDQGFFLRTELSRPFYPGSSSLFTGHMRINIILTNDTLFLSNLSPTAFEAINLRLYWIQDDPQLLINYSS